MIEKILKERIVSLELYEGKLKRDSKKLIRFKKAEDDKKKKRAMELENTITEVLSFIKVYKSELQAFFDTEAITMEKYEEKFSQYDNKFFEVLKLIQRKEESFESVDT